MPRFPIVTICDPIILNFAALLHEQVAWPCADLSVGDELVVNSEICEAAWAKLQRSGDASVPSDGVSCSCT